MNLFNSITRGFGFRLGSDAAKAVTRTPIDSMWSGMWKFIKWILIVTFLIGVIQGLFS